jgi:phosphoribosyl 1,2-cyclic phosphate phosphodiesterase
MGIPVIGCPCAVCHSSDEHNKRMRPSVLLSIQGKTLLIDCGPDFRQQALTFKINHLDGVLFTHAHHDHTASIDELRVYNLYNRAPVPCLLSQETSRHIQQRFSYLFNPNASGQLTSKLDFQLLLSTRGTLNFLGLDIGYMTYEQGGMSVNGFRVGSMAYVTDIKHYPKSIFEDLKDLDILIVSALRFSSSPLHLSVDEAVDFARQCGAKQTWLTHIAHDLDHQHTTSYLPSNVRVAYDGLRLPLTGES